MNEPEALATPEPMPASRAAAMPALVETASETRAPLWTVVLVGILGALVAVEAIVAWAVL